MCHVLKTESTHRVVEARENFQAKVILNVDHQSKFQVKHLRHQVLCHQVRSKQRQKESVQKNKVWVENQQLLRQTTLCEVTWMLSMQRGMY